MAYAALLSLSRILHQTLNRDYQYLILDEKKQIESLVEEVTFLQNCLSSQKITQDMETKIRDAAYIAEDIIESRIIDRFLTESAGHEDGSKEKILIRFNVIESWFVNSSKSASSFLSTSMGFDSLELEIAELEEPCTFETINSIRQLAKTRRFKAWFLDPFLFLYKGEEPRPDAIWALKRLATYGTKMVIISDSLLPGSTIMEKLMIYGWFDSSLFVGAITREDLRIDDAWLEELGPSNYYTTWNNPFVYNDQCSISPEMYKSAMVMAGVDAADHCIALGCHTRCIKAANYAGISSIFTPTDFDKRDWGRDDLRRVIRALEEDVRPTYVLPSFGW